ncbi:hypothetical protein JX265_005700 [Neoarthrinium moseri]|uniref:Dihydroxyacetone kinase n=1 Tax=Neoarthrinium moseri TaxID=1658444 RepID=A0A9P9WN75_9PEZI|nr:hypothetical protein JX265_005700 [Neoarthrinium moseri]
MSLGKHFINGVIDPVERALHSHLYGRLDLRFIPSSKVLYRQPKDDESKVLLLSGGGSGHEPAYAGYLGDGMLDIAVAGNIFASPSASQVGAGLRAVDSPKGTLMLVKNYTGDKLNFGLAAEKAKADGRLVNVVFINEDVSVEGNSLVGQRGLSGIVFVLKIAGALAATGADLSAVTQVAQKAADQMATAAASLDRCSVPNRGKQECLPFDEMEYGMGIHNEPGVTREKLQAFEDTIQGVVAMVLKTRPGAWSPSATQEIALMVNNLGGLSVLEMSVITDEVLHQLSRTGIHISRCISGTFLTSLDGPGFSITLLGLDEELKKHLDAPTSAAAWPKEIGLVDVTAVASQVVLTAEKRTEPATCNNSGTLLDVTTIKQTIASIATTTREDEPLITQYDTIAGDGDCGETLINGVNAFLEETRDLNGGRIAPSELFRRAAIAAEKGMGGTSGAIYAIFLNAAANSLSSREKAATATESVGHRTLMDALIPFVEVLSTSGFDAAREEAKKGADATQKMAAAMGRASYVGQDVFDERGGIPDPGALGVVSILKGISLVLGSNS